MESQNNQILEEAEDLFQLEYSELILNIHKMLEDECYGLPLYEKGNSFHLMEFFKTNSSAFGAIIIELEERAAYEKAVDEDISDDF